MATDTEIAWAAGLFEGEGCFTISTQRTRNNYKQPRLKLCMTDEDAVRRFHEIVEVGNFREESWFERNVPGTKMQYMWYVGNKKDVRRVIELLYPWLCARRKARADELLAIC